jgi:hypothetical protein
MTDALFCLEVWGQNIAKSKKSVYWLKNKDMMGFTMVSESLADIDLDCWTIISNSSAITEKIKLGHVITYMFPQTWACRNTSKKQSYTDVTFLGISI